MSTVARISRLLTLLAVRPASGLVATDADAEAGRTHGARLFRDARTGSIVLEDWTLGGLEGSMTRRRIELDLYGSEHDWRPTGLRLDGDTQPLDPSLWARAAAVIELAATALIEGRVPDTDALMAGAAGGVH